MRQERPAGQNELGIVGSWASKTSALIVLI